MIIIIMFCVIRSDRFWRENAHKLNDKNYELLKILLNLLETNRDPLVLCVACFDLGKYKFDLWPV